MIPTPIRSPLRNVHVFPVVIPTSQIIVVISAIPTTMTTIIPTWVIPTVCHLRSAELVEALATLISANALPHVAEITAVVFLIVSAKLGPYAEDGILVELFSGETEAYSSRSDLEQAEHVGVVVEGSLSRWNDQFPRYQLVDRKSL